jgi:hypothetical protein
MPDIASERSPGLPVSERCFDRISNAFLILEHAVKIIPITLIKLAQNNPGGLE